MKEYNKLLIGKILLSLALLSLSSGCAGIPLTEGGLAINKDTTACIEDIGVASLNSKF